MAEKPAGLLRRHKVTLIDILKADADFVLQHAYSRHLLSERDYERVKHCGTPNEKVTELLDCIIIRRCPDAAQGLLDLLKEPDLLETFPNLNFVKVNTSSSGTTLPLYSPKILNNMTDTINGTAFNTLEALHSTHSFKWCNEKHQTSIISLTCTKPGTVENLLKKSAAFRKLAEKNKNKELVIMTGGRAISSQCPCVLIKPDECLIVKFIKAAEQLKDSVREACKPSRELVQFHVAVNGGKNIVKILRNSALKTTVEEITVYAYKGEKVKQALKRDGRFLPTIFKKNIALCNRSTRVKTELSSLVEDLHDETFQIIQLDKSSPPASLEDYVVPCEALSQSDSEQRNTEEPGFNKNKVAMWSSVQNISISEQLLSRLSSRFKDYMRGSKTCVPKFSRIQIELQKNFRLNDQMCREVKTMKQLMYRSDFVGQVRINGIPVGSGFHLFGCCILTNFRVIKDIYNENKGQLDEKVSVHFSYDSVESTEGALDVVEVVGFEFIPDELGRDWALLRLSTNQMSGGLLKYFGFLPEDGGICIIGHPHGGVKQIDPCLVVSSQNRVQVAERHFNENKDHVQLVTDRFFENAAQYFEHKNVLTDKSCFYYGSSGSPVFDKQCRVIAVHSGGYVYSTPGGKTQRVIELAQPLSAIMERLIIQMVERKKMNVLKEYLACSYPQHKTMMFNVKELVESRNLPTFREAINNMMELDEGDVKQFLSSFSLKVEPVSMEIN